MSLSFRVFPSLNSLEILGNADAFVEWMSRKYPDKSVDEIFEGYKFSLQCCLNAFLSGIEGDTLLGIKSDFRFDRAMSNLIPLYQLEDSCEKIIFLKNINPFVKDILRAKTYAGITDEMEKFRNNILHKFIEIDSHYSFINNQIDIDIDVAKELRLIDFVHTFLVQIGNSGPIACSSNLSSKRVSRKGREMFFEGYKYAIQFLFFEILGADKFNETSLINLHETDSWNDFKYIDDDSDSEFPFLNRRFNLEEQTCFDSYFWRIKDEITTPLQEKHGFEIHRIDSYFDFNNSNYNRSRHFRDLLDSKGIVYQPNFSDDEEIFYELYWYPINVTHDFDSPTLSPTMSLCTMIAGSVELHDSKNSEMDEIFVVKFTHPRGNERNDYSYGILIDSSRSLYSSGWTIYCDICNNFTGAASEYDKIETLICDKKDKINLIEITISHSKFRDFINRQNQGEEYQNERKYDDILQKSRSYLFELFVYHVLHHNEYHKKYNVKLNPYKNVDEIDVELLKVDKSEIIVVECKLNPQNQNFKTVFKKINKKLNNHRYDGMKKFVQLWFWEIPSSKSLKKINEFKGDLPVKIVCVSKPQGEPLLRGVSRESLKSVMQKVSNLESDYFD